MEKGLKPCLGRLSPFRPTIHLPPRSPDPSLRRRRVGPPRQAHSRTDRTLARVLLALTPGGPPAILLLTAFSGVWAPFTSCCVVRTFDWQMGPRLQPHPVLFLAVTRARAYRGRRDDHPGFPSGLADRTHSPPSWL
jgi:hypothetical protein